MKKSKKQKDSTKQMVEEIFLLNMYKQYQKDNERLKEIESIFYV